MSTGKLHIWITSESEPCRISERSDHNNKPWLVGIWHCNGGIVRWCGRTFFKMPARCGHLEVDLPPGCYIVRAAAYFYKSHIRGNHWTDHGVVTVNCEQTTCVTLFAPSAHNCGLGYLGTVQRMIEDRVLPAKLGKEAVQVIKAVIENTPGTEFDMAALPAMAELLEAGKDAKPDQTDCD